jgi:hypothetical protein
VDKLLRLRCLTIRNRKRLLTASCLAVLSAGCSDPTAVETFSAMAPDPSIAAGLTKSYAAEPTWDRDLHAVWNGPTQATVLDRSAQATTIIGIDTAIREYMKALGALAADSVVQSSTNVNDLKTGLTAFQKAAPTMISGSDVTLVTGFVQFLADLAENGYRSAKLSQIIGQSQAPFQQIIDIQIKIVNRGIIPSLNEYANGYKDAQRSLKTVSPWVEYVVNRDLATDRQAAATQLAAAKAYVTALGEIKTAHTALYENRDNVLTAAMLAQIRVPAQDAYKAFQDYQAAAVMPKTN